MKQQLDKTKIWHSPHLQGALFLKADFANQRFDRHIHDEFAIGVIESGCQAFTYDNGRRLDMPGGSVAMISPGMVHEGWPGGERGWTYRMFYPAAELVRSVFEDVFTTPIAPTVHLPVVQDPRLYGYLSRLHARSEDPNADPLEIETIHMDVVCDMFSRHAGVSRPTQERSHASGLRRAREIIEGRFDQRVTLDDLSQQTGLKKFSLLRQFKALYGLPPHAFLKHVRVRRAREMIQIGLSLAEVAASTGFTDQAHMTHAFRRTVGFTPGALAHSRT